MRSLTNNNIIRRVLLFVFLAVYFAIAYCLMYYFNISCVFLEILNIPCPGCGMTRAFLSLLRLDFLSAAKYNIVIFLMPYVFMYIFFDFKHRIHKILLGIIAIISMVNWIIKLFLYF